MSKYKYTRAFFEKVGRKDGRKSSAALTKKQKTARAKKAAKTRWGKKKGKK